MSSTKNEVIVLFNGYSKPDGDNASVMCANCSCTLIRTVNGKHIIVDTMTAWDGARLLAALDAHKLKAEDINYVICTHGHSDHIGCNYLFQAAKYHIVGACVSHKDKYFDTFSEKKELHLEDIRVLCTPGHTMSCVSVVVPNTQLGGTVGICGDLFERVEDIANDKIWLEAGSEDATSQRLQRHRMAELCDYIVPGHGNIFSVTQTMREQLKIQANEVNKKA